MTLFSVILLNQGYKVKCFGVVLCELLVSLYFLEMEFDSPVVKRLLDDAEERRNKDNEKEKICLSSKELGLSPLGSTTKRPLGYFKKEIFSPTTM